MRIMVSDYFAVSGLQKKLEITLYGKTPEISPICDKNPVYAEIRVHKICVLLR